MSRTVHGAYLATIVIILYCSLSNCLHIKPKDAVTDSISTSDLESFQVVEPLIPPKKYDVDFLPEDYIDLFTTVDAKQSSTEALKKKDAVFEHRDIITKQRKTRQATQGHSQLYPQLPSGPPYNPYQTQPPYNSPGQYPYQPQHSYTPPGQHPYQPQHSYTPPGQNPYQPQHSYTPPGQNPYPPQHSYTPPAQNSYQPQQNYSHFGHNPNTYNTSRSGNPVQNYNPHTGYPNQNQGSYNNSHPGSYYNANTGFNKPNQGPFNPYTGQNPYGPHPSYPAQNSTSPGNSYKPHSVQYPSYNQSNYPHNASFRPPNATVPRFSTPYPPYNPRPGVSFNNSSYPGQPPYNNYYPPSSGNTHPISTLNSTSHIPPYYNFPGKVPSPSYNMSNINYPHSPPSPYSPQPPQNSPYYPGSSGQYPNNNNSKPSYPTSRPAGSGDTSFNPSIPNYPPQNNNQGQNNFNYPQRYNTEYDPRRVPPQNFSYH